MKVAVVEDSEFAREGLVSMLKEYPDLEIICSADHPDTALEILNETPADVLFLDIHMPGSSGFDLLARLDYSPLIIFTTAYSEYAIRSFDFNTVDYLLKPISKERLEQAVIKLRERFDSLSNSEESALDREYTTEKELSQRLEMSSRLLIKDNDECHLVELSSIRYFESCKNEAIAFFGDESAYIKRSLSYLEQRLPVKFFFRANRQYIVNLQEVTSITESISKGFSLIMSDDREIEISRRRAGKLKEILSF